MTALQIGDETKEGFKNDIIFAPYITFTIWPNFEVNGLDWQCCLADSSKTARRILIFSIAMGAEYSFEVKNIEIWVPAFSSIIIHL